MALNKFSLSAAGSLLRRAILPSLPQPPLGQESQVEKIARFTPEEGTTSYGKQFFSLGIKWPHQVEFWRFPIEPLVSISGSNTIVKRNVAKMQMEKGIRGTVKERWNQDDYKVTITGILCNLDDSSKYPEDQVMKLREYCEGFRVLDVESELLYQYGINSIVIESYDLPFTPGENLQAFTINAVSDSQFELFISTEG